MSDDFEDPRYAVYPTLDDLLYRVQSRLGSESEMEGDTLHRVWHDEGHDVEWIAQQLGTTLARTRYLMLYFGVSEPQKLSRKQLATKAAELAGQGYTVIEIAKQLGTKTSAVKEVVQAYGVECLG